MRDLKTFDFITHPYGTFKNGRALFNTNIKLIMEMSRRDMILVRRKRIVIIKPLMDEI